MERWKKNMKDKINEKEVGKDGEDEGKNGEKERDKGAIRLKFVLFSNSTGNNNRAQKEGYNTT